jgi:hypothetical protein
MMPPDLYRRNSIKAGFNIETFFEKIVFISPFDHSHEKELILTDE